MKKIVVIIFITIAVGMAFSQTGTGVIRQFLQLTDVTPSTYSGQGGKVVAVNSGGTALEFSSVNYLTESEIDASSELLAIMDDETGTGFLVFATDPDFTTGLSINTTTATDPYLEFKTTNTAHEVDIYLDESSVNDELKIAGRTALKNTTVSIEALDGENAVLYLVSGTNFGYIYYDSTDRLFIVNNEQDEDIILQINDGGVTKTITWDAANDKLLHSGGTFNFDDDNLTTAGTFEAATITEGNQAVWNATETDILDSGHYIADSIDNEHINWTDIDNLGDEGAVTLAATTTALATARTIAGVSFDGTGNIAIASTGLSDTADLLYEAELDDFSELDTQIVDKSLVNMADGATWLGVHTFGGATTVIPWKVNTTAAPTIEGQAIWESDTDELTVGDGSVSVVIAAKNDTVFAFNIHDIDSGMDDIKMPFVRATTITKVTVFVTGGTNVVGRLYEVDGDGDDADAVGMESSDWTFTTGETEDSSFNNATFDAGDWIQWDTTSVSGSVTGFAISVEGYEI